MDRELISEPPETGPQPRAFAWWQSTYSHISRGLNNTRQEEREIHSKLRELKEKLGSEGLKTPEAIALGSQEEALASTAAGESSRLRAAVREAAAVFVEPLPDKPWLEPRKVPALPHVRISAGRVVRGGITDVDVPGPGWDVRVFNHPSKYFNTIDKFYLPSEEYFKYFKQLRNRTAVDPDNPTDSLVFNLARDALMPLEDQSNPSWWEYVWLNWAQATKVVGLDSLVDQRRVNYKVMLHIPERNSPEESPRFYTKEELFAKRDALMSGIVGHGGPRRDGDSAREMWGIISAVRWNIDHKVGLYDISLEELLELYSELNFVQETSYPTGYRAEYPLFAQTNSLSRVMTGGRMEQYYADCPIAGHTDDMYFDEVDAIFLTAVHILGEYSPKLNQIKSNPGTNSGYEPERYCPFGINNGEHHRPDQIGLVLAMAMQYFRMDDKLKAAWRPVMEQLFTRVKLRTKWQVGSFSPTLVALGTEDDGWPRPQLDRVHAPDGLQGPVRLRADVEELTMFGFQPEPLTLYTDKSITGFGTDKVKQELVQTDRGHHLIITPLSELPESEKPTAVEVPKEELRLALRAEARLPKAEVALIREVEADPEAGDLDRLGALRRIAERLTGRKIPDLDITQTLKTLGILKQLGQEVPSVSRAEAPGLLFEAQFGDRAFADLDPTTQLLIVLRSVNRLPKELIVEHLFQSLVGAAPISLLRLTLAMEKGIREQRPWEEAEDMFEFPVFTGREKIAAAKEKYGPESPKLRREVEEVFGKFLSLMQANHTYESSIDDILTMLEVLEETGQPMSQCAELAYVACEMQNWMMGESTSRVAYRERFNNLPLTDWLKQISIDGRSSTFDHIKVWTKLPSRPDQDRRMIIDETSGYAWLTNKAGLDQRRTAAMTRGEYRTIEGTVGYLDYTGHQAGWKKTAEGAIVFDAKSDLGGPQPVFLADAISLSPELRAYARALAPDQPTALRNFFNNETDPVKKWHDLIHLMDISPREIADNHNGRTAQHQREIMDMARLSIDRGSPERAIFLTHVVTSLYPQSPIAAEASNLFDKSLDLLAAAETVGLEQRLNQAIAKDWILPEDRGEILSRHQAHLEYLRELARQKQISLDQAQRDAYNDKLVELVASADKAFAAAASLPDDLPLAGLGHQVAAAITADVSTAATDFRLDHQLELLPDSPPEARKFVNLDPAGAGFAIAEITRGLPAEQAKKVLEGAELIILRAEKDFGYDQLPGGVQEMWTALEAAVESQGLALPYSRQELVARLPEIIRARGLSGSSQNLLTTVLT